METRPAVAFHSWLPASPSSLSRSPHLQSRSVWLPRTLVSPSFFWFAATLLLFFFLFFFAPPPPSPSPLSRYFETFPPSAPATNHLSLDILQSRFPKEGSGLPSSSLSAQPLGPPSATRRVFLGQVRAVAVVGQTVCVAHFSPPQGCGGQPALETTCNSLDVCFQGLRAQR